MQTCMVLPPCRSQTCDPPPLCNGRAKLWFRYTTSHGDRSRTSAASPRRHALSAGRLRARQIFDGIPLDVFVLQTAPRSRMAPRCARPFLSPCAQPLSPAIHLGAATQPLALPHSHLSRDGLARGTPKRGTIFIFYSRSCLAASVSRRDDASAAIAVCHHCRLHSSPTPLAPSRASASPLRSSLRSSLHTPAPDSHHRALATRTGASAGRSYNEWRSASCPRGRRRSRSTSTSKAPSSTSGPSSTASDTASSTRARPTRPSSSSCWSR